MPAHSVDPSPAPPGGVTALLKKLREAESLPQVLDVLVPGRSVAVLELRSQVRSLCEDVSAHGALILGPPGSGKSTLARVIALGRYVHLLKRERVREFLKSVNFDGPARISTGNLDWYREMSLTGLTSDLANAQLFGIVKGAATDVRAKEGIFALAMRGLPPSESAGSTRAALATGGVVFLDEVGDLLPELQPKLLTVLTGAEVSPVGAEGDEEQSYSFRGLTLAATWKDPRQLRPDLRARLADHVIRVPALSERIEDLPIIAEVVLAELQREADEDLKRILKAEVEGVDRERLAAQNPMHFKLTQEDFTILKSADWAAHDDLRGLEQVISRACRDKCSIGEALVRHHPVLTEPTDRADNASALLTKLFGMTPSGAGLSGFVGQAEQAIRSQLTELLRQDQGLLHRLAAHLGVEPSELKRQLGDLPRQRRKRRR
jgi:DNA-binding NtrC family response regulator